MLMFGELFQGNDRSSDITEPCSDFGNRVDNTTSDLGDNTFREEFVRNCAQQDSLLFFIQRYIYIACIRYTHI